MELKRVAVTIHGVCVCISFIVRTVINVVIYIRMHIILRYEIASNASTLSLNGTNVDEKNRHW